MFQQALFQPALHANPKRRRAVAAVLVMVTIPVLLAMAALTVDVGVMYNVRAELQGAADGAALAGASSLLSDAMTKIRLGSDSESLLSEVETLANVRSSAIAALNPSLGTTTTYLEDADIQVGYLNISSASATLDRNPTSPNHHNAVQVTVRRSGEVPNGVVSFFFAPIFGTPDAVVTATATAAFDDRIASYDASDGWLLPFTIHRDRYQAELAAGGDAYGYDEDTGSVTTGADGIREINLYPSGTAPGNFGALNLPSTSPSDTPTLKDQIENGVPPEDLEHDFGGTDIAFTDADGDPLTYSINGNPGLAATLASSIETRVGEVVGFFLHDQVTGSGSNTFYRVFDIRFGRVMKVKLTGPPSGKGFWVQPVTFTSSGLNLKSSGPSTGSGLAGRVVLVR